MYIKTKITSLETAVVLGVYLTMKLMKSKNFFSLIALLCIITYGSGFSLSIKPSDILNSVGDMALGIGSELGNIIPTPKELFQASKYVLFGLPEIAVFKVINEMCSIFMASDKIEPRVAPKVEELFFQFRTACKNTSYSLMEADKLLDDPEFDVNKKVVVFITGWMSNLESDYIEVMAKAYNCRGGYNFLALNNSNYVQTLYTWSAFNTEEVGRFVAQSLEKLATVVPTENFHLIGHSLGAHIVGSAARHFTKHTNETFPRITGLDPANPCFNEGETLSGLYRGDAKFVDVIHSNPGVLGKRNPIGDIDFYPEGLSPLKPGCVIFSCSHSRAYEYFIESIFPGNENNFLAKRCGSLGSLNDGYCNGPSVPMGYATPHNIKGDYFLSVNGKSPFGKSGKKNGTVNFNECGRCQRT